MREAAVSDQAYIVHVNGAEHRVPAGQSVRELLVALGINPDRVAVELNREIVRKRNWDETRVPDAAQLEIVEFVGGG